MYSTGKVLKTQHMGINVMSNSWPANDVSVCLLWQKLTGFGDRANLYRRLAQASMSGPEQVGLTCASDLSTLEQSSKRGGTAATGFRDRAGSSGA